jgi:aldoxime dehydratase
MTESSIPSHLLLARRCPRRVPENFAPPYPSYCARFPVSVQSVAMAYLGVQSAGPTPESALEPVRRELSAEHGPQYWEPARYVDPRGFTNWIAIAYWTDASEYEHWIQRPAWSAWWSSVARSSEGCGYFLEALTPRVEHFETLYSSAQHAEGIGRLGTHMSGEVQEHAYWGSARERIPIAQTDRLLPSGRLTIEHDGPRMQVHLHDHVCVIRSGQDWSQAQGRERDLYLNTMEPVLRAGMKFLRDSAPAQTGCYSCRYMDVLDQQGRPLEKRFGLAWFRSLEQLEHWAESHPTHIDIFGTFMRIVEELGGQLATHFWHEVTVARAAELAAEYIQCHEDTGVLRAALTT